MREIEFLRFLTSQTIQKYGQNVVLMANEENGELEIAISGNVTKNSKNE